MIVFFISLLIWVIRILSQLPVEWRLCQFYWSFLKNQLNVHWYVFLLLLLLISTLIFYIFVFSLLYICLLPSNICLLKMDAKVIDLFLILYYKSLKLKFSLNTAVALSMKFCCYCSHLTHFYCLINCDIYLIYKLFGTVWFHFQMDVDYLHLILLICNVILF